MTKQIFGAMNLAVFNRIENDGDGLTYPGLAPLTSVEHPISAERNVYRSDLCNRKTMLTVWADRLLNSTFHHPRIARDPESLPSGL